MAELAKKGLLYLMNEKCFDNYFVEFNFFDLLCFKMLLSKGLGLAIIAGSVLVKVPQILKIFKNKSAEGINLFSVCLDLFAITCHISYSFVRGFPFSAWGDGTFLALQTVTIAALVLYYNGAKGKSIIFVVVYFIILYALNGGLTPVEVLWTAQGFNIPILALGKLSQAFTNYKNGGTGQLSSATCFMLFFGSTARIFTSIQETGDPMMIFTYCVSTFANGVIVSQIIYYNWKTDDTAAKTKVPSQKTKAKAAKAD
uniref:Mannose-P-dolichol utilization defect 1 protein homolog n=1 Tax=Corethrella appendiculata TaxID=1370023 RepID=U5EZL0_9DIPT